MADAKQLEDRLKEIGCNFRFRGRAELRELANVLMPDEIVEHCVNGRYTGGYATLVTTDQRVLLIDKKPMYLTLEDTRYDMVAEVDFNHRMMDATIFIRTPNKALRFTAYNQGRLRQMFQFIQMRVMQIRQHYQQAAQAQQTQQYVAYAHQLAASPQQAQQPVGNPASQQLMPPLMPRAVAPIISAYTRLPLMSRQRRFLGSKAMNTPFPSIYSVTPPSQT